MSNETNTHPNTYSLISPHFQHHLNLFLLPTCKYRANIPKKFEGMSIKVHFRLVIMWSFDIFIIIQEENQFPLFDDIEGHQGCINRGYNCVR